MMRYAACFKTRPETLEPDKGRRLLGLCCGTPISQFPSKKTCPEPEVVRIGGDLGVMEIARKSVCSSVSDLIYFMVMSDGPYKSWKRCLKLEVENKSAKPVLQKDSSRS